MDPNTVSLTFHLVQSLGFLLQGSVFTGDTLFVAGQMLNPISRTCDRRVAFFWAKGVDSESRVWELSKDNARNKLSFVMLRVCHKCIQMYQIEYQRHSLSALPDKF